MCTAVVLSCFFVYSFVYLFIYYSLNIFSLCVFVCICLFITTLISSYFPAWPSHSARLAFAISEWLCSLSFTIIYFYDSTLLYQEHNKDCCVLFVMYRYYCLPEVVLAEVLGYCKRAKDHGYLCGPCFPGVMAAE